MNVHSKYPFPGWQTIPQIAQLAGESALVKISSPLHQKTLPQNFGKNLYQLNRVYLFVFSFIFSFASTKETLEDRPRPRSSEPCADRPRPLSFDRRNRDKLTSIYFEARE